MFSGSNEKDKKMVQPSIPGQDTDTGTVKWFSVKKGFGFIETEGGEEVFVHYSSITGKGYRVLEPGDRVSFQKVPGPKGQQAFHVVVLKQS